MEAKDFWPIGISVVSLLISCATAYWTLFLQSDEVYAYVNGGARYTWNEPEKVIEVNPKYYVTLINAGNRTIVVDGLFVEFRKIDGKNEEMKCADVGDSFHFALLDATVMSAGSIAVRKGSELTGQESLPSKTNWKAPPDKITALVCMAFNVITTDGAKVVTTFEVERQFFDITNGKPIVPEFTDRADQGRFELLKRWRLHF